MSDELDTEIEPGDITPASAFHAAAAKLPQHGPRLRELAGYHSRMLRAALIGDVATVDEMESRVQQVVDQLDEDAKADIAAVLEGAEPATAAAMPDLPDDLDGILDENLSTEDGHKRLNDLIDQYGLDVSKGANLEPKVAAMGEAVARRLHQLGQVPDDLDVLPGWVADAFDGIDFDSEASVREKDRVRDDAEGDSDDGADTDESEDDTADEAGDAEGDSDDE